MEIFESAQKSNIEELEREQEKLTSVIKKIDGKRSKERQTHKVRIQRSGKGGGTENTASVG